MACMVHDGKPMVLAGHAASHLPVAKQQHASSTMQCTAVHVYLLYVQQFS